MARDTIPKLKFKKKMIEAMGRPEWDRKIKDGWEIQPCHAPCSYDDCEGWVFEPSSIFALRHGGSEIARSGPTVMVGTMDDPAFPRVETVDISDLQPNSPTAVAEKMMKPMGTVKLPFVQCSICGTRMMFPPGPGTMVHDCPNADMRTMWTWNGVRP